MIGRTGSLSITPFGRSKSGDCLASKIGLILAKSELHTELLSSIQEVGFFWTLRFALDAVLTNDGEAPHLKAASNNAEGIFSDLNLPPTLYTQR